MLSADIEDNFSRTLMAPLDEVDPAAVDATFAEVEAEALESLTAQGVPASLSVLERQLELRYLGQEHSLTVTVGRGLDPESVRAAFQELHAARYGHAMASRLQILNLRLRAVGRTASPTLAEPPPGDGNPARALLVRRDAFDFGTRAVASFAVYDRALLAPGDAFDGPALVDEGTSTTVVPSGQRVTVDARGYLLVVRA
jgi:N-methylhydantoinase A